MVTKQEKYLEYTFTDLIFNSFGTSTSGRRQAMKGEIVTSPADRQTIARILMAVDQSPSARIAVQRSLDQQAKS